MTTTGFYGRKPMDIQRRERELDAPGPGQVIVSSPPARLPDAIAVAPFGGLVT